nr:FUSC family protein [Pseudomonas chlororaphis]
MYRLGEWIDLWQDCRSLQHAIQCESQDIWRAVYRHWRLGRLTPFLDRGLMLYSVASTVLAIIVASVLWILLGCSEPNGRATRVQTKANSKPMGPARLELAKLMKSAS